ncbi:MAG: HAMP domain-containing histidine kinase [Blautia sp.]|nr:HAMP domain-containing histidine kinase [Lachnoclostridium sp.]MCM1212259.1 HAMP domain-containing histidine kinase [Blautia sp.]
MKKGNSYTFKKFVSTGKSRFPYSLFLVYWMVIQLMSGMHIGVVILITRADLPDFWKVNIPMIYWALVALGLTLFTKKRMQQVYEIPLQHLAKAAQEVANGDFSVYVPPVHTADKADYLDIMIEDFNKMVEELGSIETLKTDFFANVSHEIKTPLSIIQNNAELLCRERLPEKQKICAETIHLTTQRLSDLISNILKLNKLEKQSILPDIEVYDLCTQLAECAVGFEDIWERQGLSFEADLEDCAPINADGDLMALVWNNLLSNAIKFTESGGMIFLKEESGADYVKVSVQDTGCGMSEETMKHIFEKFYQGDTSHSVAGNGLGLALALRVLQLHHFEIEVSSGNGKGSVFTVTMPKGRLEA